MKLIIFLQFLPLAVLPIAAAESTPTLADTRILGGVEVSIARPPAGLKTLPELQLLVNAAMEVRRLTPSRSYENRATITPNGDLLYMGVMGEHYAPPGGAYGEKRNQMIMCRSTDGGYTWSEPTPPWELSYALHGFIPLVPKGSKRLYCFGTEPKPDEREGRENAPIAYRYSDDDGHTWSQPVFIRPRNDPDFKGMSVMRMTETDTGTWLLGSHEARWEEGWQQNRDVWSREKTGKLHTRLYLLRSEDRGRTWTVLPDRRPNGWSAPGYSRMDEGRPLSLGGGRVILLIRTPEGHLWKSCSKDDGKSWSAPEPTPLIHPDAPPMLFHLSDGKTLIAFHHNKYDPAQPHFNSQWSRNELWFSLSQNDGETWSEPRFILADASAGQGRQVSYADLVVQDGILHLFLAPNWEYSLHFRFKESDLARMPTADALRSLPASHAGPAGAQTTPEMPAPLPHPRSVHDRVFDVWRNPGRFTKNPDIIELPSGRLMLVYSDTEKHLSQEDQHLFLLVSDDEGRTWRKHAVVDSHDKRKGEERLVTPRLSRLNDGRLVVLIDQDDWGHYHEDQVSGIMAYWSSDNGETWGKPQHMPRVKGFEPDRMIDLPDGSLGFAAHVMRGDSQEFADVLYVSEDGGQTWKERATIAHDGYHRFCEGAIVVLDGGKEIACVLRENHSAGIPSFVAFSQDGGRTWTQPQMLPFAFHRPYVKQLPDGRVFVTGRNVLGGLGTYGWTGDLRKEAGRYEPGGPAAPAAMQLTPEALVIENKPGHAARFTLLPPESSQSEVIFSARVKVEGPPGEAVAFLSLNRVLAFRGPVLLKIASDGIWLTENLADERKAMDMTPYREVAIRLRRGLMQIYVDEQIAFSTPVFWESLPLRDSLSNDPSKRTQFGQLGDTGRSHWQRVTYRVFNPTHPVFTWHWQASNGKWPDQYQRDRLIQIHSNPIGPGHGPDHGYSSWLTLRDGRILLVDYTNRGDPPGKSHLVGVYLSPEDLAGASAPGSTELKSQ